MTFKYNQLFSISNSFGISLFALRVSVRLGFFVVVTALYCHAHPIRIFELCLDYLVFFSILARRMFSYLFGSHGKSTAVRTEISKIRLELM